MVQARDCHQHIFFHPEHVGQNRADVAAAAMRRLRPSAQIRSRLEDVRTQVDIEYFRGFDLVLSMVNDDAADEHISRMCVAASVPMVAVGATAESGQVTATAGGHPPDGQTGRPPHSVTHALPRSLKA